MVRKAHGNNLVEVEAEIHAETEKAFLLDHGGDEKKWVPKSQVEDNGDGTFSMPEWLAKDKGMI